MVDYTLYDKYINLRFMKDINPSDEDTIIDTPETGRKPHIHIKGSLIPSYGISIPEIRITNFYPDRDLSDYKYLQVKAGYFGGLSLAFRASMLDFSPFVEKPSPDGVIAILCVIGDYEYMTGATMFKEWPTNTSFKTIMTEVADNMKLNLEFDAVDVNIHEKVVIAGPTRAIFPKLKDLTTNINIQLDTDRLLVYNSTIGRQDKYIIDKISMAAKKGPTLTITGPWIPSIRPGDVLELNPKFYKQGLGSTLIKFKTNEFITQVIDFAFDTINVNQMIITALNKE